MTRNRAGWWFGRLLPWIRIHRGEYQIRYAGRVHTLAYMGAKEARRHRAAPGWRFGHDPDAGPDEESSWPGVVLSRRLRRALQLAEAQLVVRPEEERRRGFHTPGLLPALDSWTVFVGGEPKGRKLIVRPDARHWRFEVGQRRHRYGRLLRVGTITPDFSALVDGDPHNEDGTVRITWSAHGDDGRALATAVSWPLACEAIGGKKAEGEDQ